MIENKHTAEELAQLQRLPLEAKIQMSRQRVRDWYNTYHGSVFVSFSGGKDSTVLLDLVRKDYPDVQAAFVDTGLEYPETREFVKTIPNVAWLRPEKNFRQVIREYGYPVISKDVAHAVAVSRRNPGGKTYQCSFAPEASGKFTKKKWISLLDAPFPIDDKCCYVMKKAPAKKFQKETGKKPILGTMASESVLRKQAWMRTGCNAYDAKNPKSAPLSFWTENDVLTYIKERGLKISPVYGEIVRVNNQLDLFGEETPVYKTTGCDRTGCMFCLFGCHLEKEPNRFQRMRETHPQIYDYCMRPVDQGGLGLDEVLNFIGVKH